MNDKELYEAAIAKWGKNLQIIVAIEEMSELQKVLCKYLRNPHDLTPKELAILSMEIADAEIMLEQLKIVFYNTETVREAKKVKLNRLEGLVKRDLE